jgi:hypothetical protein
MRFWERMRWKSLYIRIMRVPLTAILAFALLPVVCYSQKNSKIESIDSLSKELEQKKGNYEYIYGSDGTIFDFRMDSIERKLITVVYRPEVEKTFLITYYFQNNYLIKVESRVPANTAAMGTYYFYNNRPFKRKGRNYKIGNKGSFSKMSPKKIYRQLNYIYYQFEFFVMNNQKPYKNPPALLQKKREEVQSGYHHMIFRD